MVSRAKPYLAAALLCAPLLVLALVGSCAFNRLGSPTSTGGPIGPGCGLSAESCEVP